MFLFCNKLITLGEKRETSTQSLQQNNAAWQAEGFCISSFTTLREQFNWSIKSITKKVLYKFPLPLHGKALTQDFPGCLWHSHGKNPVRLYPKLQSQPIGLSKIFIDYLFFQADQSDCTKSVSIQSICFLWSWNQNVPCQICRPWVFPLVV